MVHASHALLVSHQMIFHTLAMALAVRLTQMPVEIAGITKKSPPPVPVKLAQSGKCHLLIIEIVLMTLESHVTILGNYTPKNSIDVLIFALVPMNTTN
jgi:hypothetical protein